MKNKIAIYGASGHGFEIKMLIDQINDVEVKYEFIGFFDDAYLKGSTLNGQKILKTKGRDLPVKAADGNLNTINSFNS